MHLNLGITADAAAAHRHEYSASPDAQQGASTFFPSARSILYLGFASLTKQGGSTPHTPSTESPTPMEQNTYQSIVPSSSGVFQEPAPTEETAGHTESGSDSPDTNGITESPSSSSKKQPPRSKTILRFAHPPPSTRHKRLRIRPKLLLQLQRVSNTSRPISTYDVIPSSLFKARSPRKLPSHFAGRDRVCAADLIVVPSDTYGNCGDETSIHEESANENREPIATISQLRKEDARSKGSVEIYFPDGLRWVSEPLPKGGYEFTATDDHGIKKCVRWVVRGRRNRSSSIQGGGRQSPGPDDGKRLTFSIIDPQSRRHPIIGWICRTGIEVLDQESLSSIYANPKLDRPGSPAETTPKHSPVDIDDRIRKLITITGIWVAFQEGWAGNPHVTYNEPSTNGHNSSPLPSPSVSVSADRSPDAGVGDVHTVDHPDCNNSNRQSITSRLRHKGRRSTPPNPRSSSQKPPPRRSCSDDGIGKGSYPSTPTHARSCSMLCTGSQASSPPNHPHRPVAFQDLTDHETSDEMNENNDSEAHSPGQAPRHSNRNSVNTATSSPREQMPTPDQSVASSAGSKERKKWRKIGDLLDAVRAKKAAKAAKQ